MINEAYIKLKFICDLYQLDSRAREIKLKRMQGVFKSGLHRLAIKVMMRDRVGVFVRAETATRGAL